MEKTESVTGDREERGGKWQLQISRFSPSVAETKKTEEGDEGRGIPRDSLLCVTSYALRHCHCVSTLLTLPGLMEKTTLWAAEKIRFSFSLIYFRFFLFFSFGLVM